ncbi:MAG: hypothetical protein JWP02_2017 [Acidimicrobiales bacterium]|nr:hypothetical protein [Acidimicrobiales bacterium]
MGGADVEDVHTALADLDNHWQLADRFVVLTDVHGPATARTGGEVWIRGPLIIRRRAELILEAVVWPTMIRGVAMVGAATSAAVVWTLRPADGGVTVELSIDVVRAGRFDALMLRAGRRWIAIQVAAIADRVGRLVTDGGAA